MRCCCSCSWCCCFRSNQNTDHETLGDASSQNHHRFFFFFFFPFLKRRRVRRKTRDDGSSRFRSSPSRSFRSSSFQNASSFARIQPTFIIITSECLLKTKNKVFEFERDDSSREKKPLKKTLEKKSKISSRIFSSLRCTIFLFRKAFGEEAAALFSLAFVRLSLRRILSTEEERARVGSFFDRNEIIHLPFGMKDDDKEEEIFLSSV